jgi:hypothetical protein
VLLITAGLFIKSLQNARQINPGFEAEKLLIASVNLGIQGYDRAKGRQFQEQIVRQLERLPGVESASLAAALPRD